ncbi:hypothetical protein V1282_001074 [Nitrobacteraceae bacterium AZCC 2146]
MDAGTEATGREIVALALLLHIGLMRRRALDRILTQFVRRPESIEDETGIGQQVLAALLLQPDRIGKHRERIGLGEIRHRVKTSLREQFIDLGLGRGGEAIPDLLHHGRRQHLVEHRARPCMRRRIGLEDEARRPPRLFLGEIAQAHTAAGTEGLGIVEHRSDFGIARHRIDIPFVEMHHRPRLAQHFIGRMRILEKRDRERIDVEAGDAEECAAVHPLHAGGFSGAVYDACRIHPGLPKSLLL